MAITRMQLKWLMSQLLGDESPADQISDEVAIAAGLQFRRGGPHSVQLTEAEEEEEEIKQEKLFQLTGRFGEHLEEAMYNAAVDWFRSEELFDENSELEPPFSKDYDPEPDKYGKEGN